jgi:hypothetical protein
MSRLTALIPTILLALTILAGRPSVEGAVTAISFSRHFNLDGAARLVDHDQARARTFRSHALRSTGSFSANHIVNTPITNALVIYIADVDIGTPPTTCEPAPAMRLSSRIAEMSIDPFRSIDSRYWQLEHLGRWPTYLAL